MRHHSENVQRMVGKRGDKLNLVNCMNDEKRQRQRENDDNDKQKTEISFLMSFFFSTFSCFFFFFALVIVIADAGAFSTMLLEHFKMSFNMNIFIPSLMKSVSTFVRYLKHFQMTEMGRKCVTREFTFNV